MVKVVFVLESQGFGFGGAEIHLRELVRRIDRGLFTPTVLLSPAGTLEPLATEFRATGVAVGVLPAMRHRYDVIGFRRLVDTLVRLRADIVHVHIPSPSSRTRRIFPAARLAGAPVVVSTEHSHAYHYLDGLRAPRLRDALLVRFSVALQDCLITVSQAQRRSFVEVLGIPARKLITIHNGVDQDVFSPRNDGRGVRRELGIDGTNPLVGMVSGFFDYERCDDFLHAAAAVIKTCPDAHFLIVGGSNVPGTNARHERERNRLATLGRRLGLTQHLQFSGFRTDMPHVMAALDVLVLPATFKSFGLVLIEAMASEKPVVATNVGGVPEIVVDGETGVLVPPLQPDALASAVTAILCNTERAAAMGRRARQAVERHFTLDRMVGRTAEVYLQLLGRQRSRHHTGSGNSLEAASAGPGRGQNGR